jgi:hypothetical protein
MSRLFDARHRWGDPVYQGARFSRTCQVCGRVDTAETLVPQGFIDLAIESLNKPNPYRDLFGRVQ